MAARSTYKLKKKPAIPFGDLMLPILGVVVMGILIVGIRVFFFSGDDQPPLQSSSRPIVSVVPSQPQIAEPEALTPRGTTAAPTAPISAPAQTVVVAEPAVPASPARRAPAQSAPAKPQRASRPAPAVTSEPIREKVNVSGGSINDSVFLVQCGSFTNRSAANNVAAELKSRGHSSLVRPAEVRGTTYFRVFVAGGRNRATADTIANQIKALGHQTLVVRNQ